MNKLLPPFLAMAVASATLLAHAQDVVGKAQAGAGKVAMCVGCHGIVGYQASFPEVHKVPKIAGQTPGYIKAALGAYRGGERKHPTMQAIAASLTDQDIADLAAYYGDLGKTKNDDVPGTPEDAPSEAVQKLIGRVEGNACTTCHGANFNTPNADNVPKLAGQYKDYMYVALRSYKVENNLHRGRANGVMSGQAKQFKNDELKELAGYISSLPGNIKTVPESKFHTAEK